MRRLLVVLLLLVAAVTAVVAFEIVSRQFVEQRIAERHPPSSGGQQTIGQATAGKLKQLAVMAVSADPTQAEAGQQQIAQLLGNWKYSRPRLHHRQLHRQLRQLASALRASGPGADPVWTAATARWILRLAEDQKNVPPPALVDHCQQVLQAAAAARTADQPVLATGSLPAPANSVPPAARVASVAPAVPAAAQPWPQQEDPQQQPEEEQVAPLPEASSQQRLADATDGHPDWRPDWATPNRPKPPVEPPVSLPPPPQELLHQLTDRQLLVRYLPIATRAANSPAAVGPTGQPVEPVASEQTPEARLRQAVIDRGYGGVSTDEVAMLLSPVDTERRALVDRLLRSRSSGAARLLLLLAADESPLVRHDAILTLGSSADVRLVDAAWRFALNDHDPRVARLASQIQNRR